MVLSKQSKVTIAVLLAITVFAAIAYFLAVLVHQKVEWYKYFKNELTASEKANQLGITNEPSEAVLKNLNILSDNILWKIRKIVKGLNITSGYRSGAVNEAVGGVQHSQHLTGEAVDFKCDNMKEVFDYIKNNLDFDQLIWEGTWIHVSYSASGDNRKQVIYK